MVRLLRFLPIVIAVLLPLALYPQYLSNDAFLYEFDSGQSYYGRFKVMCDALQQEGCLPLWQRIAYGGGPFHANPENPTLYLPALALAAFMSPLAAINAIVLMHLSLAIAGMYCLVNRLWRRAGGRPGAGHAGALVAGVLFGLNYYTRLEHFNLVTYGAAHALIPWIFWAGDRLLTAPSPRRHAAVLALLVACQCFSGGLYVFAYTSLGLCLWFLGLGLLGGRESRRRAFCYGTLACALAALLILAKLLPAVEWLASTNRAEALDPAEARGVTLTRWNPDEGLELGRLYSYLSRGIPCFLALLAVPLLRLATTRMVFILVLCGLLVALGPLHGVLHAFVPPFDRIRNAVRAWTLVNAFLPVAAGLGAGFLLSRQALRGLREAFLPWIGLAGAAGLLPLLLDSGRFQPLLDDPASFAEVKGLYPNWTEMADKAGGAWRAACLNVRTADSRNEQFIASALDVETVAGFFGHAWPVALERHAFPREHGPASLASRLRRLQVLSVRYYVYGGEQRQAPVPVQEREIVLFPRGIDGGNWAENHGARPRAFLPAAVCAVLGDSDREVVYALFDSPSFRPDRATLLSFDSGTKPPAEVLDALDEIVVAEGGVDLPAPLSDVVLAAPAAGRTITRVRTPLDDAGRAALEATALRLSRGRADPREGARLEALGSGAVRVTREDVARGRLVVLSETWQLHGGWTATTESRRVLPLLLADGVATAVFLRPGEGAFVARYRPAAVRRGLCLGGLGLLACFLLLLPWPARLRERAPVFAATAPHPP